MDKNDSWQSQCIENVDSMLDEFHLASIDEQRIIQQIILISI